MNNSNLHTMEETEEMKKRETILGDSWASDAAPVLRILASRKHNSIFDAAVAEAAAGNMAASENHVGCASCLNSEAPHSRPPLFPGNQEIFTRSLV